MQSTATKTRRKKYSGYNTLLVLWHESSNPKFNPIEVLSGLAKTNGLVATAVTKKNSQQLRIDTPESSPQTRKRQLLMDRKMRLEATKLLRRALKDPRSAERIRSLVERARQGDDVGSAMSEAMDPDS